MFCLPLFCCLLRSLGLRFCPGANAQRLYHAVSCPNVVSDSDAHGDSNTISLAFPFREGAGHRKTSGSPPFRIRPGFLLPKGGRNAASIQTVSPPGSSKATEKTHLFLAGFAAIYHFGFLLSILSPELCI